MKAKGIRRFPQGAQVGNRRRWDGLFDSHFDRQLDKTAAVLRHMDDRELAARHRCDLRRKHAALLIDHVSDLHALRSGVQKPFQERSDHGLVAGLPGDFCQSFCQGLVGVLKSAFYLFQSSAPFLTA